MADQISDEWKDYAINYWKNNDTVFVNEFLSDHGINKIVYILSVNNFNLKKLFYVRTCKQINYLRNLTPFLTQISVLKLKGDGVDQASVDLIAKTCRNLKVIHIRTMASVSCKSLKKLYDNNVELRGISLFSHECDDVYSINNPCLRALPKNIRTLNLISCNLSQKALMECLVTKKTITILRLDDCVNIPCDFLYRVITVISNIEFFSYNCIHLAPKFRQIHAVPDYSMLRSLILYYNPLLNDEFLGIVSKLCIELEDLQIGNPPQCENVYENSSWSSSDRTQLNVTYRGLLFLPSIERLKYLALYGLKNNNNLAEHVRMLAYKAHLEKLVIVTMDEDFSDVALEFISLCHSLREFTVLGHTVSENILLDGIAEFEENLYRNERLEMRIEEASIRIEEIHRFTAPMLDIRLSTCNLFCEEVVRKGFFYHNSQSADL